MFDIYMLYGVRNIKRTPLRSSLSIFSVALIICLYTVISGIGVSFVNQLDRISKQRNVDIIIQSKYSTNPISSSVSKEIVSKVLKYEEITNSETFVIGGIKFKDGISALLAGVTDFEQFAKKLSLVIKEGRPYQNSDEILVAARLAKGLKLSVGDDIQLSERKTFKIVGTYETWINLFNASIVGYQDKVQDILNKKDKVNLIFLTLKDPNKSDEFIKKIDKDFSAIKAIRSGDFSNSLGPMRAMFYLMEIISAITLILSSVILLNIFIIAIHERKKEIGILLSIGWDKKMVYFSLVVESVCLSLAGGVVGFFVSYPIVYFLKKKYILIGTYLPTLSISSLFEIMFLCLIVGVVSVIIPTYFATKVNIAKVLKDE